LATEASLPIRESAWAAARTTSGSAAGASSTESTTETARGSRSVPTASSRPTRSASAAVGVSSVVEWPASNASISSIGSSALGPIALSAGESGTIGPRRLASRRGSSSLSEASFWNAFGSFFFAAAIDCSSRWRTADGSCDELTAMPCPASAGAATRTRLALSAPNFE
jgi:hypothetical protein